MKSSSRICRGEHLSDEIQLTDLPWRTLVTFLPKSISEGLVVSKHCEISSFQHIPKVSDSRVDSKEFTVVGTVRLFR
ncbi:hypothetical protein TNCV_549991 [Trichonephila clavipes]|nr:hypothetical protein TNCV_549991 [Trichonephila clavipes]